MPQLRLAPPEGHWVQIRDGDPDLRPFYNRHYSARRYQDGRRARKIVGPGQYILLVTAGFDALFGWRKCRRDDGQHGLECNLFRNEGDLLSSTLILEAETFARAKWPRERRFFTYIDEKKIKSGLPGNCFLAAGWRYVRKRGADGKIHRVRSKDRGLLLLAKRV